MNDTDYEAMARFVYGAARYGGNLADVTNWMASALDVAVPVDEEGMRNVYNAFFAKYHDRDALSENHAHFMEMLKSR